MSDYKVFSSYKSAEVTFATGTTDSPINCSLTTHSNTQLEHAEKFIIKTDKIITVKFNETTNDAITLAIGTHEFNGLVVKTIYVSNSAGSDAAVKVIFFGKAKVV